MFLIIDITYTVIYNKQICYIGPVYLFLFYFSLSAEVALVVLEFTHSDQSPKCWGGHIRKVVSVGSSKEMRVRSFWP